MKRPQNGGKAWINGGVDADFSQRSNYSSSWFPDVACWSVPRPPTAGVFPLFSTQNHHSLDLFYRMCFNNCLCFSIILNLKGVMYWISSIVLFATTTAGIFRHRRFLSNISLYISTTAGVLAPFSTSKLPFLGSLQSGKSHHCLGQSPCSCDV